MRVAGRRGLYLRSPAHAPTPVTSVEAAPWQHPKARELDPSRSLSGPCPPGVRGPARIFAELAALVHLPKLATSAPPRSADPDAARPHPEVTPRANSMFGAAVIR